MLIGRHNSALVLLFALVAACSSGPGLSPGSSNPTLPPGVTASPPDTGSTWRYLADFPAQGASDISSVVAQGSGFVAVGSVFDPEADCLDDVYQGRVWSSSDGATWTTLPADALAKTRLTKVFTFAGALYVVGVTGTNEGDGSCPQAPDQPGLNLWRSADSGATWQRLAQAPTLADAAISDVIVVGDQLLVVGALLGTDTDHAATWTSPDATTWTPAELAPDAPALATAAAHDRVIVGFGDDDEFPLAWISRDLGANWYEESIDLDGFSATDVTMFVEGVVATGSGFIAVGDGCCIGVGGLAPIVFSSADGTQWIGKPLLSDRAEAMRRIVAIPAGLLAVGVETYVNEPPAASQLGGRSWVSVDGTEWRRGPDLAELGDGNISALAAGAGGVVVAGTSTIDGQDPANPADTGLRVWFASYGAFAASKAN